MDKPLSVNDLLFVNAYFEFARSAVKAYRTSHPKASYATARVEAYRVLAKPSVQAEIARRVQHDGGITREFVESALLTHYHAAEQANDYVAASAIAMDCAKLAGFLVEKRADVTEKPLVDRAVLVEELRLRGLVPSN